VVAALLVLVGAAAPVRAGGPRWVAGTVYFDSSVLGMPLTWAKGAVSYYTDLGDLSSYEPQAAADALVAAAAGSWNGITTTTVSITNGGSLSEDVNGSNVSGTPGDITWPADVESTAKPVAVVYDEDGSVLNTVVGAGASDPNACSTNAAYSLVDMQSVEANILHAIIILNGLCATSADQIADMQYQLAREFGRVLGMDFSQANDNVFTENPPASENDLLGWPLMHPINLICDGFAYNCTPNPYTPRMDDRATLGRMYPSSSFSSSTIRVHGTVSFANGQGMQGVDVIATKVYAGSEQTDTSAVASCVSGFAYRGNAGNVVTGTLDAAGNSLLMYGSNVATAEGEYDLGGLEIPAGAKTADYQITLVPINELYSGMESVGPDILGNPLPSGTMPTVYLRKLAAGADVEEDFVISDSADDGASGWNGTQAEPNAVPANGYWAGREVGYGHTAWFAFSPRANRIFTVIATALDETRTPSEQKALLLLGLWYTNDAPGSPADFATSQALDSSNAGETQLEAWTPATAGVVAYPMELAIADARGDGRPDYNYSARVFYGDTLSPAVVPVTGGQFTIRGMGFGTDDMVTVGGVAATVVSESATTIVAMAPAAGSGVTGPQDVEVMTDNATHGFAILSGALSYGAAANDTLVLLSAPTGNVNVGATAATAFAVQAQGTNGVPEGSAQVTFSVTSGSATFGACSASPCAVTASSSGVATTSVTPTAAGSVTIAASLANGATVSATFNAVATTGEVIAADVPNLWVAQNVAVAWPLAAIVTNNGAPASGVTVDWTSASSGVTLSAASSATNTSGVAAVTAQLPAMASGATATITACIAGTSTCASFVATAEGVVTPTLVAISGSNQVIPATETLVPLVMMATDGQTPANPIAGLTLTFNEDVYSYPEAGYGRLAPPRLLEAESTTMVTNSTGEATIQPAQIANVASTVAIVVTAGPNASARYVLTLQP
jgi:hypothetical protein